MQKDAINLRVAKNDVVNQINISNESILISGSKIHITGSTTIDNAVIKTAMLENAAITTAKIADASITNAKIANLDAGKINTGILSADRIAAGSITSAKLTVANGFITNAMIADATIQSAKIVALDAGKITAGILSANRIAAYSITADKLATNAIQVGLAGWTNAIRITPTRISWYNGSTLAGYIDAEGMSFYYGTRFVGRMGESGDAADGNKRGIATHLNGQGDYITWAHRSGTTGNYTRFLTLDPRGSLSGETGVHFGTHLRLNGYNLYTSVGRAITLIDNTLTGTGTFATLSYPTGGSRISFTSTGLFFVTDGTYYNCTNMVKRLGELISRMNSLINYFNQGWVKSITAKPDGGISWSYFDNTGLSTMATSL